MLVQEPEFGSSAIWRTFVINTSLRRDLKFAHLFEYHVQGNLIAPTLPNQGDHPLRGLLLPLLADQDVRPAPLLHLLHGLAALADDHADGGAGHHHLDRPLALGVGVVELAVPLLHLLHQLLHHAGDGVSGASDQADAVLLSQKGSIFLRV